MDVTATDLLLKSLPTIGALTAFLALFHLTIFFRHSSRKEPVAFAPLWVGLLCMTLTGRAVVDYHRFLSSSAEAMTQWTQHFWSVNSMLIIFVFLYFSSAENRWPNRWEKMAVAASLILMLLNVFSVTSFQLLEGRPFLFRSDWNESVYQVQHQYKWPYPVITLLALSAMLQGIRTGLRQARVASSRLQGNVLVGVCVVILIFLLYNQFALLSGHPPLVFLLHLMVPLLLVMTMAITDTSFRHNEILAKYDRLRLQLQQLVQTVPGVPYQMLVADDRKTAQFTYVSPRLPELFGLQVEPLNTLVERLSERIGVESRGKWLEALQQTSEHEQPLSFTGQLSLSDGKTAWFRAQSIPVQTAEGVLHSGILIDVTREKEAELDKTSLLNELNLRNRELESVMYSATHDLKTPLVNLECFSNELMQSLNALETGTAYKGAPQINAEWLESELRDPVVRLHDNALRIGRRLNALLSLTRSGRTLLLIKPGDPLIVIQRVEAQLQEALQTAQATLYLPASLPVCLFDANQFFEVIRMLLENALQYRSAQRPLEIHVQGAALNNGMCRMEFSDNGQGFDNRYAEIIFDCFHQLNPSRSPGEGIGLTVARTAMARMQGAIYALGRPGEGATFYVELPLG